MPEWKAIWEQPHHRLFGVSYAVFSSSTLIRFLGTVSPKGCLGFATSKLICRRWHFWVPCRSVGKANATTPCKVAKLREGPAAKPGSLHSAQLYKSQFKLREWVASYTPLETVWKRRLGIHFWLGYARQSSQSCAISMCVAVSHNLTVTLGVFCSSWSPTPWETGLYKNVPYQNKMQKNYFLS